MIDDLVELPNTLSCVVNKQWDAHVLGNGTSVPLHKSLALRTHGLFLKWTRIVALKVHFGVSYIARNSDF